MKKSAAFPGKAVKLLFSMSLAGVLAALVSGCATDPSEKSMLPERPRQEIIDILDHFPAGSIDSATRADQALEVIRIEKNNLKARLYNEKLECNKKFFVYWCYEEAEDRRRTDLRALRMLEVEAKRFKRSDEIRQRDLSGDTDRAETIGGAPQRSESLAAHEARVKRVQEREARRAAAARGITATPDKKHSGNLMTPAEKAENVREYQAKQEEAVKRQERVEQKRAETQQKRDKKAEQEAAKSEDN